MQSLTEPAENAEKRNEGVTRIQRKMNYGHIQAPYGAGWRVVDINEALLKHGITPIANGRQNAPTGAW